MTRRRGKLANLRPVLGTLCPSVAYQPEGEQETERHRNGQTWRRWYKLAEWKSLRWATLVRDGFQCQMCGRVEPNSSKLVADHREPHRGDPALFFDPLNLWTLCKSPCHDQHKQRIERQARGRPA